MAGKGPAAQANDDARDDAALAALLDPVALERRLQKARAQRAAALAARQQPVKAEQDTPLQGSHPKPPLARSLAPAPVPLPPPAVAAAPEPAPPPLVAERRPTRPRRRLLPAGLLIGFAAGATVALAAVLALAPRADMTQPGEVGAPGTGASVAPIAATPAETRPAPQSEPPAAPRAADAGQAPPRPDPAPAAPTTDRADTPGLLAPRAPDAALPAVQTAAAVPPAADTPAFADRALRLILHAPSGVPAAEVEALLAGLSTAVRPAEGPIRVNFAISRSNVRYYHREDADAAAAASASLSTRLGPVEVRDFTSYQPSPAPGTIEIWLSGSPAGGRSAPAASPPPVAITQPQTAAGPAADVPPQQGRDIRGLVQTAIQHQALRAAAEAARAAAQ